VPWSTPWGATSIVVASASSRRTSSSRVALLGVTTRAARRSAVRVAVRKKVPFTGLCISGELKNVASCTVTTTGSPDRSGIV
jgi:hypothetical protein